MRRARRRRCGAACAPCSGLPRGRRRARRRLALAAARAGGEPLTRPNRHMGSSSQGSLDAHAHGSHGSGSRSPTWREGSPQIPRVPGARQSPSSLHPGHSAAVASPSAQVSLGSPRCSVPKPVALAVRGHRELGPVRGGHHHRPALGERQRDRARSWRAQREASSDLRLFGKTPLRTPPPPPRGSGSGSSAADSEAVTREAALLKDFAYVNLSELARENANALSRGTRRASPSRRCGKRRSRRGLDALRRRVVLRRRMVILIRVYQ